MIKEQISNILKSIKQLVCFHKWTQTGTSNIGGFYQCEKCGFSYWGNPPKNYQAATKMTKYTIAE